MRCPPLCFVAAGLLVEAWDSPREFAVVSYLPEWRYEGANWDAICEVTTHLLLFSVEVGPGGHITALDRFPRKELLAQAKAAALKHGTKLLLCFGGNGRSAGFSAMVRSKKFRKAFVARLVKLLEEHDLDGVDYNWEYPGYDFSSGYLADAEVHADYVGLGKLLRDTRQALDARAGHVTLAYYPDTRQEKLLMEVSHADRYVSLMHAMAYDQGGRHSTLDFGLKVADQGAKLLPPAMVTLGLPFYARDVKTGEWKSYEDVLRDFPTARDEDEVGTLFHNSRETIRKKVKYAVANGLGGVMIWEVGQDCRVAPVTHGQKTHVMTCPNGRDDSLLFATRDALQEAGVALAFRGEALPGEKGRDSSEL